MRTPLVVLCGVLSGALVVALLTSASPALGQQAADDPYVLKQEGLTSHNENGVKKLTVVFTVTPRDKDKKAAGNEKYEVVISQFLGIEGREVRRVPISGVKVNKVPSAILAVDISGSMAEGNRIEMTRNAVGVFFTKMPAEAETGLILFNHEMAVRDPLTLDRRPLLQHILNARPSGGTAYLDATVEGVKMLAGARGNKVIVVMTDGVDLNSKPENTVKHVIDTAKAAGVKVYTVGIGEPGRQEKMTSVLVLDRSGSMLEAADDQDRVAKVVALKQAANLFMSFVREGLARTTVLTFSDAPDVPRDFTSDRAVLRGDINKIKAAGETAFFDATYEAIAALEAERPVGKRAVVALTDGVDNMSRRRVEEVIARAREAKIPLYLLGFGRKGELDEKVMTRMAKETGGAYFHAQNQKALMEIFEKLANRLHDDGIDEATLKKLANETGGQYYHARDVNKMELIIQSVVQDIQKERYMETFDDLVQVDDGRPRDVRLELVRGGQVVQRTRETTGTHGLIIPEANHFVYLGLLGVIGLLIALPAGLRRMSKPAS
jgi:VWFA-related protein